MKKRVVALFSVVITGMVMSAAYADQVAVTVYNNNLGVVRETRELSFDKGKGRVSFIDVASQIDPTSVGFELADKSKNVAILEQNYAYDLVSSDKIYDKFIDKDIDLIDKTGKIYSGTLLSHDGGTVVLKDKAGKIQIVRLDNIATSSFPELPGGLITRPTLFWNYESDFSGKAACDVSYQTGGLSWTAEYVGILSSDEKNLDLTGWSSITNNSGATYKDATLKLVAGDIHRATPPQRLYETAQAPMMAKGAAGFEEKQFFEYHLYTLPRPATVADNEIKQISLFEPARSKVEKEFYFEPEVNNQNVQVQLKFINSKADGLGMPLPAGRIRVFKADSDGSMILLGEDAIKHTPRDEKVQPKIGFAFDISAGEKVLNYARISDRVEERSYEISLRNHKSEDVIVMVKKHLYGDWSITKSNFDYTKEDASTVVFSIPVKANGEAALDFVVRTSS